MLEKERPTRKKAPAAKKKEMEDIPVEEENYDEGYEDELDAPPTAVGNTIDLPSKGALGYPSTISYREVMAGDEEILKTSTGKNYHRTINRVLKSICNEEEFFDDLSVHDRDFILAWIWANTYSPEKTFEVTCSHCGHKEDHSVNMTKLDVNDIHSKFKKKFPIMIKKADQEIKIRMFTVRDENIAEKYMSTTEDKDVTQNFIMRCLALDFGKPMQLADRLKWVRTNVSATEMNNIKKYHETFHFGLDTDVDHTCSECEGVTHGSIPFHPNDILAPKLPDDFEELLLA